ncbi:MAG: penicillin-binding protein 1C [Pedobacter sp.]|nr:penicillin-binding protein 1C [Pedobacter sp.]
MRFTSVCLGLCLLLPVLAEAAAPVFADIKNGFHSSYAELQDRNGVFLHARRLDMQVNRLSWVELRDISPALLDAVIFTEDREFYDHHGIDWSATALATFKLVTGDKSRGASTISMQLAGLLNTELAWRSGGRSLSQKWNQMQAARELESAWSKSEILEAYFNLVTFRGDLQGIAASSRALLGKAPIGINRDEGLLLASLLASPTATPERVTQRACAQIAAGFQQATCSGVRTLAFTRLVRRLSPYPESPALEAMSAQLLKTANVPVRTSIDAALQKQAQDILVAQLAQLRARNVNAGAVLVLDNATGEVRAYVGNAGLVESARFYDGVQALRQAGSTLKPFLYELAIEKKYLTAASVLEDSALSLATPTGLYTPQNYEGDFKGPVSARVALASSLNIPAVRVLNLVGVENGWMRLRQLGFSSLTEAPDFYGFALALGGADVSLWMQANAYRTLANGGLYSDAGFIPGRVPASQRVLGDEASFVITDILSDRSARALTFGLENPLATPFWSAVKTGTSKDMRDNWCIGFSRRYTVAAWVGNLDGAAMHDVSGITGAAPIWAAVMNALEGGQVRPGGDMPPAPLSLVRQRVKFFGLKEPAREEWFLPGTEMSAVEFVPQATARISYPANETIIAIDPDIPEAQQRVRFRAEAPERGMEWWLDGTKLGPARDHDWKPQPGQHRLSLRDAQRRELDAVIFTVRGQWKKP